MRALLCAIAAVVLAAAGCAPAGGDDRGMIVFADGRDTSQGAQIKALVNRWNADHPGQYVRMVELPESTDDHRAQLAARAQDAMAAPSATGGCADVITLDVVRTAEFAHWGYIEPLDPDDFDGDAFLPTTLETGRYRGRQYGIPLRADVGLLYYRKDVLDAEGMRPPRTWEELRHQAVTVAPRHGLAGYVTQLDRYEGFTVNALEAIWAAGGAVVDGEGDAVLDPAEAGRGFQRIPQGLRDRWILPDSVDYNEEGARIAFQGGRALFMRNWTYAYRLLGAQGSPLLGRFGVAPLPWSSALGGWNLALSRCSRNRDTARAFIRYLTSESSERTLFTGAGFAPARRALYEDPILTRAYPHLQEIRRTVERARSRPVTPDYDRLSDTLQEHLHPTLTDPPAVAHRMSDLAEDLRALTAAG
ncbi:MULTISPECIES: ABC transporter substrate-binding protein [Thermomonospora]|uniref:Multiple sugar transport system substrate-binding protein n=1 Tax=Thermomonospora cellulosilytica TaxID=1411118 RepID=A0A7W3N005_9ACTN|nr:MULTISPECIES: ABC transporter substrate-binding protein [Thermomonospora]MBA9004957.1 multiple sugar transport system substrate-binding protein [Thermomonospora cellulosilytica]